MFPESHGFVAVPPVTVTRSYNLCPSLLDRDKLEHVSLIQLLTGIATKPWLSGNMVPNIKTSENERSNFSENLRVIALKLLELTRFASLNLSIYFNFVWCWVHCDRGRFSVRSPFIEKCSASLLSRKVSCFFIEFNFLLIRTTVRVLAFLYVLWSQSHN